MRDTNVPESPPQLVVQPDLFDGLLVWHFRDLLIADVDLSKP